MIDKETISSLRLLHGAFNAVIILLFAYHASVGIRIRRGRRSGGNMLAFVRRHRKMGPVVAALGIAGYLAGIVLILVHEGRVAKYPLHFGMGSLIVLSIVAAVMISRRITAGDSLWRDRHYLIGRVVLFLYGLQAFLGLGILL